MQNMKKINFDQYTKKLIFSNWSAHFWPFFGRKNINVIAKFYTITLPYLIVGGGKLHFWQNFHPISIYYDPPNLWYFRKLVRILLNSCRFWAFSTQFQSIKTPIYKFEFFSRPPNLLDPPPLQLGRGEYSPVPNCRDGRGWGGMGVIPIFSKISPTLDVYYNPLFIIFLEQYFSKSPFWHMP